MMTRMQQRVSFSDALGHVTADKRIDILRQIGAGGSISQAARAAGVSYKAAWQALDTLTNLAGVPLVERAVGGVGGGGTQLTTAGLELLVAADAMDQARRAVLQRLDGQGPPAAGRQADLPGRPDVARLAVRTSMRNQWPCVVRALEPAGAVMRVHLRGADAAALSLTVCARVTRESAELLALQAGSPVIAMCKATAVQVEAAAGAVLQGTNRWAGTVTRAPRPSATPAAGTAEFAESMGSTAPAPGAATGAAAAPLSLALRELSVQLDAGVQMVGFAPASARLRARSRVVLSVDESAVVLVATG